jgi:hypothetical protein
VTASASGGSGYAVGGAASASAIGVAHTGNVQANASASGGAADPFLRDVVGGAAKAYATGLAFNGNVQANASATGGAGATPGAAFARSLAKNASGEVITTASAPGGGAGTSPSGLTAAAVGPSGPITPVLITAGRVVSDAIRTPVGQYFGVGAMSAAYGGLGPLQYEATAVFTTPKSETLYLNLMSDNFGQPSFDFDTLTLEVFVNGIEKCSQCTFSSLAGARAFFTAHPIDLGAIAAGESITMDYFLGYKSGTSAVVGDGFGFTYDLATAPVAKTLGLGAAASSVPEPSTWAMMLIGLAGLGFVASRSRASKRVSSA